MTLSNHSHIRVQQRAVSVDAIEIARQHGRRIHTGGAVFCFLGRRDIPDYLPAAQRERLEGLTLVLSPDDETVITAYRNRRALKDIRRKKKYNRQAARYSGNHPIHHRLLVE